jgi:hypothetical protein
MSVIGARLAFVFKNDEESWRCRHDFSAADEAEILPNSQGRQLFARFVGLTRNR